MFQAEGMMSAPQIEVDATGDLKTPAASCSHQA